MKLRRFISMMLIVTMLTVFAGCGNKDDRTQAAKKLNLSGPITVNVWYMTVHMSLILNSLPDNLRNLMNW